jgi:hypothetical protein
MDLVERLNAAAVDVTRQLPEAHFWSRWWRTESRFRTAAERFIQVLYSLDVGSLSDESLAEIERLTKVALNAIEIHMLLRYTSDDTEACRYCTRLIERLRDALDALDAGLPTDPSRRPSREQLLDELAADLRAHSVAHA